MSLLMGLAVARALPEDIRESLGDPRWQWEDPSTGRPSASFSVIDENKESMRWWRMSLLNKDMGSIAVANFFEETINASTRSGVLLQPGDILVTDNTRILHNRSAFVGERRVYRVRFW